jgi:hypothetical protein
MNSKHIIHLVLLLLSVSVFAQDDEGKIISKYDFIPGEKIVFYDDFSAEGIGDFPLQWNTNSSGEIVSIAKFPGRWFQMTGGGFYIPEAKEKFTDNCTIEFDIVPYNAISTEYMYNVDFIFVCGSLSDTNEGGAIPGKAGLKITPGFDAVNWTNWSESVGSYKDNGSGSFTFSADMKYHVCFLGSKAMS